MPPTSKFKFRRLDKVGFADADEDKEYLAECFVDTGDLSTIRDCSDPRSIIMGGTGSGKSALISRLQQTEARTITVPPESLALSYISNSTILTFISGLGVKLDIFFKLLWRHVLTVELIKAHYKTDGETPSTGIWDMLLALLRDRKHQKALEYLRDWGKSFWEDTDYRIKELTNRLETNIASSLGAKYKGLGAEAGASAKLSEEERVEVVQRAQSVVNRVQIRELSDILGMLNEVLKDPQKRYYLVIDRLDENWVEDRIKILLIRALIETVRDFRKVQHAKVVIALRRDLYERVFRLTRDPGFQEEKYESLFLNLKWSRERLVELLDRRVDFLVRRQYTGQAVSHKDLLPQAVRKRSAIDYIIDRTLLRPRDMINFFNIAIERAVDSPVINSRMLLEAEGEYSRLRLRSLADEWYADYPNLFQFLDLLKTRESVFELKDLSDEVIAEHCLNFVTRGEGLAVDDLSKLAHQVVEHQTGFGDLRRTAAAIFYRIGLAGLKLIPYEPTEWTVNGRRGISLAEIHDQVKVSIHPAFWRVLGTKPAG